MLAMRPFFVTWIFYTIVSERTGRSHRLAGRIISSQALSGWIDVQRRRGRDLV